MPRSLYTHIVALGLLVGASRCLPALERPQAPSSLRAYVQAIEVEAPVRYRNLSIFPVTLVPTAHDAPTLESLDSAVRDRDLVVSEVGEGEVNDLAVENFGKVPVFIMAGEILEGAKQTRVLQSDVLVPPHSGKLHIGAFCVEHGRWSYQSGAKDFQSGGLMSNPAVRAQAQMSKDQGAVWAEVEQTHRRLGVPDSTGALTETSGAPQVADDITPYVRHLEDVPESHPHMAGAVVMVGDRLLCADTFGTRDLLASLWPKLIRSYALEAVADADRTDDAPSRHQAESFLGRLDDARLDRESTPGSGVLEDISGPAISGSTLMAQGWPLHIALFPRVDSKVPSRSEDNVPALQRSYQR